MSHKLSVSESLAKELTLLRDAVGQLQNKVTQQEVMILKVQHEMIQRTMEKGRKGIRLSSVQIQYRTCYDLFRAYKDIGQHHLKSGMFWVDLDGPSQGEPRPSTSTVI